jgi:hypothetical protein
MNTATVNEARMRAEATRTAAEPAPQRDAGGRFVPGNRGGPGNPFARRVALLRKVVLEVVSDEDLAEIVRVLVALAKKGDVAAARLVMGYTIGKPAATIDPDRVEIEEWKLNHESSVKPEDFAEVLGSFPAHLASKLADIAWPCVLQQNLSPLQRGLDRLNARDEKRRRQQSASNGDGLRQQTASNGGEDRAGGSPVDSVPRQEVG